MLNNLKLDAFSKLHNLLIFYSEYRDHPVKEGFDFLKEVKSCCEELELDSKNLKRNSNFKERLGCNYIHLRLEAYVF